MSVQPQHPTHPAVTLYMLEGCSLCEQAREFLQAHSVPFAIKRIDIDDEALDELLALSGSYAAVPFIWVEAGHPSGSFGITRFIEADVEARLARAGVLGN